MNIQRTRNLIPLLLLVMMGLFLTAMPALAQQPPPGDGTMKPGPPHQDRTKMLRLTDEQRKKVRAIRFKYEEKMDDVRFELKKKRFELAYLLRRGEEDRKKIDLKIDQIMVLEKRRHKLILDEYFDMKKILTKRQNKFFLRHMIRAMTQDQR